jgi:hypothetical protein
MTKRLFLLHEHEQVLLKTGSSKAHGILDLSVFSWVFQYPIVPEADPENSVWARGSRQLYCKVTSTLGGGEWSASSPGRFTPGERAPGTHSIGGWADPRAGLDDLEKRKFLTL